MPFTVNSYAICSENEHLHHHKLERRDVETNDILIDILYTGICHTDIHTAFGDWGKPLYPLVLGHEIVGVVSKIGPEAKNTHVGDVVAIGCMVDSCGKCEQCHISHEMFCVEGRTRTYNSPDRRWPGHVTAGGYSESIVVQEHFVLKVPKSLQDPQLLRGVAPILCAGISTYSPLCQYKVREGSKVAIVGLGGLGQMGVKLARALGAEVTVISRSHAKDEQAKVFGAHKTIASVDQQEMESFANYFDLVIDTVPFEHDLNPYISTVKPYGNICVIGHIGRLEKNPLNTINLVFGNKRLSGSAIGGIKETQELLDFCGQHKIISDYKLITMDDVNDAWNQMHSGGSAERFIIDIDDFRKHK